MEGLTRLVSDSLARHGIETALDYRRLQWSKWFHCESSVSFVLAPSKPGIFALAEEMISAGETAATNGKRMLALIRIAEAGDLGMALGRMFLPGSPERDRLLGGHCFARYAVIEDEAQRHAAYSALQQLPISNLILSRGVVRKLLNRTGNRREDRLDLPPCSRLGFRLRTES